MYNLIAFLSLFLSQGLHSQIHEKEFYIFLVFYNHLLCIEVILHLQTTFQHECKSTHLFLAIGYQNLFKH